MTPYSNIEYYTLTVEPFVKESVNSCFFNVIISRFTVCLFLQSVWRQLTKPVILLLLWEYYSSVNDHVCLFYHWTSEPKVTFSFLGRLYYMHRYAFSLCTFSINTYKLRLTMLLLNFYLKSYATDTCLKLIHVATWIYHGLYE